MKVLGLCMGAVTLSFTVCGNTMWFSYQLSHSDIASLTYLLSLVVCDCDSL